MRLMKVDRRAFVLVFTFLILYAFFLILWVSVKDIYGCFVPKVATEMLISLYDVRFKSERCLGEKTHVVVVRTGFIKDKLVDLEVDFPISVSVYSFNVPLTLSCVFSLMFLLRLFSIRVILEILIILFLTHVSYVFIYERLHLIYAEAKAGMVVLGGGKQLVWELLWAFWDNMLIRFEPFLAVVYIFLRGYAEVRR